MINVNIKTNITDYQIEYVEGKTNNKILFFAYPNCINLVSACIDNKCYYFDNEYVISAGSELVIRDAKTYRKLGKNQKAEIIKKVNEIIKEGNEYLQIIFNKGKPELLGDE